MRFFCVFCLNCEDLHVFNPTTVIFHVELAPLPRKFEMSSDESDNKGMNPNEKFCGVPKFDKGLLILLKCEICML